MKCVPLCILICLIVATSGREFRDYDSAPYDGYDDEDISEKPYYDLKDAPQLFEKFIKDYHKVYANEEDKMKHYEIFKKNVEEINRLNKGKEGETATFDINLFTDKKTEQVEDGSWDESEEKRDGTRGAERVDKGPRVR